MEVTFACGHAGVVTGRAAKVLNAFVLADATEECVECDLIADATRVRVNIGFHLICHCLRGGGGSLKTKDAYAYALKKCTNCDGTGVQP